MTVKFENLARSVNMTWQVQLSQVLYKATSWNYNFALLWLYLFATLCERQSVNEPKVKFIIKTSHVVTLMEPLSLKFQLISAYKKEVVTGLSAIVLHWLWVSLPQ